MKEFLSNLFEELNDKNITYCVLRNYEELPERIGNDVDIWVKHESRDEFYRMMLGLSSSLGFTLLYRPKLSISKDGDYYFIKDNNKTVEIIHIDCWSPHWKGISLADEKVFDRGLILDERKFFIPSPGVEASTMLMPKLIYRDRVQDKYKRKIKECLNTDAEIFLESFRACFGNKTANFILSATRNNEWGVLEQKINKLRFILFIRSFLHPVLQLRKWLSYIGFQIRKYFIAPHGLFVVLIGPDGTGKSTVAKALIESEEMRKLFQKETYFHGHFSCLPELKEFLKIFKLRSRLNIITSREYNTENPKPFSLLRSMVYPLYYGLNYLLGHFFIFVEKGRGGLITFDRYFYDYFLQIPYNNCPRWLLCCVARIIPKPDIIIYLENRPEVIYERKPELPIEEIERQSVISRELIEKFANGYVVENSKSLQDVILDIQKIIIRQMEKKTMKI